MALPTQIGRFKINRELGKGSQGVVYLATDPRLERQVAIKTLPMHASQSMEQQRRLLKEARLVSKLQHPNIIPLYEAGEHEGLLYLVFEFVVGVSLKDRIRRDGPYVLHEAISLLKRLLSGIRVAHEQGIVHRDLSPSNIMIDDRGTPRIMDFGISVMVGGKETLDKGVAGTPIYMSPEHFSKEPVCPQSDLFSLGLIFYEMIIGQPAIEVDNHVAAMYKIAHEPLEAPSLRKPSIDKKLDAIFLKAVEKKLANRYGSASEMVEDLDEYLEADEEGAEPDAMGSRAQHSTLDFLLRRIRMKSDFPTFSQHIMEINKKASVSRANYASASELSNAILKDYSLTNKLLKLVNSAFYGQFAGAVTTVSRAVVILGFEEVKTAATGLLLFEHLKDKSQSSELRDAAIDSFMSGILAKELAERSDFQGVEEAFICSMLHNLGKHLTLYYFPEECQQIQNLIEQKGIKEAAAVRKVLGISYEELGRGIAKSWQFPEKIINSLSPLPRGKTGRPQSEPDVLRTLSTFSNELISITGKLDGQDREKALTSLLKRFEESVPISRKQVTSLLDSTFEKVEEYAETLNIDLKSHRLKKMLKKDPGETQETGPAGTRKKEPAKRVKGGELFDTSQLELRDMPRSEPVDETDRQSLLINGIQDITNTLVGEYDLNDLLTMILETMYRGFDLDCVLLCIADPHRTRMRARLGFGEEIDRLLEDFQFPFDKMRDVFSLAITQGKDIRIDDAHATAIRKRLPDWFHGTLQAGAFVLFPVVIDKKPFGLFYLDKKKAGQVIDEKRLNYLRTLRNQAVLAIQQKR